MMANLSKIKDFSRTFKHVLQNLFHYNFHFTTQLFRHNIQQPLTACSNTIASNLTHYMAGYTAVKVKTNILLTNDCNVLQTTVSFQVQALLKTSEYEMQNFPPSQLFSGTMKNKLNSLK